MFKSKIAQGEMQVRTKLNIITILLGLCFICISTAIYILLRTVDIPVVRFAESIGLRNSAISENAYSIPAWIRFSLPDGLWLLSYEMFVALLWKYDYKNKFYILFYLFMPLFAIVCELLQINGVVRGTFDVADIICYIVAAILGLVYCITFRYLLYEKEK